MARRVPSRGRMGRRKVHRMVAFRRRRGVQRHDRLERVGTRRPVGGRMPTRRTRTRTEAPRLGMGTTVAPCARQAPPHPTDARQRGRDGRASTVARAGRQETRHRRGGLRPRRVGAARCRTDHRGSDARANAFGVGRAAGGARGMDGSHKQYPSTRIRVSVLIGGAAVLPAAMDPQIREQAPARRAAVAPEDGQSGRHARPQDRARDLPAGRAARAHGRGNHRSSTVR